MKLNLTYNEANLLRAIIWELVDERGVVHSSDVWRLSDVGEDICQGIAAKLEEANDATNRKSGKGRNLYGAPKGSILDARWSA